MLKCSFYIPCLIRAMMNRQNFSFGLLALINVADSCQSSQKLLLGTVFMIDYFCEFFIGFEGSSDFVSNVA
jgi:hypothetical protein